MNKPKIEFNSRGESGNIYFVLALVRKEFCKQKRITEYNKIYKRVITSGSYAEALKIIREKVDLTDLDNKE